jgi:hypothetical protein
MAKPIFTVGVPTKDDELIHLVHIRLKEELHDYHSIVYSCFDSPDPQFKLFSIETIEQSKIDDLQKLIFDSIKSIQNNG